MVFPNPTLLLVCVVASIGVFFTGFQSGRHWEQRDALANVVAAQNAAIERANKESKAEADARAKAREARHKGELDAQRKANPLCNRDADSLGLLVSSISLANGEKDTAPVVSHPVRSFGETIKRFGFGHTDVGVQSSGSVRSVPSPAQ
jgi:DNA-binding transcriptional regulator of glucitol operon